MFSSSNRRNETERSVRVHDWGCVGTRTAARVIFTPVTINISSVTIKSDRELSVAWISCSSVLRPWEIAHGRRGSQTHDTHMRWWENREGRALWRDTVLLRYTWLAETSLHRQEGERESLEWGSAWLCREFKVTGPPIAGSGAPLTSFWNSSVRNK